MFVVGKIHFQDKPVFNLGYQGWNPNGINPGKTWKQIFFLQYNYV